MHTSDEWELSKENIQPLRQGRKMEILQNALKPVSDGQQQRTDIERQKMEFESELRSYRGSDPLKPYISYIDWTEQHFPKGGREGSLTKLLEKCITEFVEDSKYKDDARFTDICIKLANIADNSLELFSYLHVERVGHTVASFYVAWAHALEAVGSVKKADNVFMKGIENGAEPKSTLELRHKEFLARVMNRPPSEESQGFEDDDRRVPMSSLKSYGKKKVVGTTRTGSAVSNRSQGIVGQTVQSSQNRTGIVICLDENDSEQVFDGAAVGAAVGIPMLNAESRKENERKPGKWTGAKMSSKVATPAPRVSSKFDIHTDEASFTIDDQETPLRQNKHMNGNVPLSEKKEEKRGSVFRQSSEMRFVPKTNEVHMFRRDLVYKGVQEFQFEEVRFAIYKKKQENERLQKEQRDKLRLMEEKIKSMERQQKEFLDFVIKFLQSSGKPANTETIGDMFRMMGRNATEQDVREVTQRYNETLVCPDEEMDVVQTAAVDSDSNDAETPMKPATHDPATDSANGDFRGTTPTIHTKEAMKIVMDIFNLEDRCSRIAFDSNATPGQREGASAEVQVDPKPRNPIVVFEDPIDDNQPPKVQPTTTPFVIYEDKTSEIDVENCQNVPPDDYVQVTENRTLAGFLQPSLDVSFEPLNEDPESEEDEEKELNGIEPLPGAAFSFILPSDTLFFKNHARVVSTPISSSSYSSLQDVSKVVEKTSTRNETTSSVDTLAPPMFVAEIEKRTAQGSAFCQNRSPLARPGETKYLELSTIAETSRDYKSSSSGSSGTSSGATSHFRSTTFRNKTRAETSTLLEESEKSEETVDPFDPIVINGFLNGLDASALIRDDIVTTSCKLPKITPNIFLTLVNCNYTILSKVGSGAYASVYKANRVVCEEGRELDSTMEDSLVLKVQTPGCPWEFYICDTLHRRLTQADNAVDVTPSIMKISRMYLYEDGSIIETEFHNKGTLLNIANLYKKKNQTMPEILVMYFTIEILHIIEQIHSCRIIHADIKPDNFMFVATPTVDFHTNAVPKLFTNSTGSLKLIDFGRSIDMSLFPSGTEFNVKVETKCFDCIEMKEGRPWTYQTDLFGVASCAHVMLFGEYMVPKKKANGTWQISSTIRRYWNAEMWHLLFHQLLNIPSSDQLPNLAKLRSSLEDCFLHTKRVSLEFPNNVKELSKLLR